MMTINHYRVAKSSATYMDDLTAVGLADLLREMSGGADVRIRNVGDAYEIIAEELKPDFTVTPGYRYIRLKDDNFKLPFGWESLDYEKEKQIDKTYRDFMKTAGYAKDKLNLETPTRALPEFRTAKVLNSMRKGFKGDISLTQALANRDDLFVIAESQIKRFTVNENQAIDIDDELQKLITTSQFYNPSAGKGVNRPKPAGTTPAGFPKVFTNWFDEWLKFRGAAHTLLGFFVGKNGKDIKIIVIDPTDITINLLDDVYRGLLKQPLWGGSVQLEIKTALTLAKILIKNSAEFMQTESPLRMANRPPSAVIRGLSQAYFKSLGTAAALMNSSFIGLPGWFKIDGHQAAVDFVEVLDEHELCLRSLDERKSSDKPLLLTYRDFVSSGNMKMFLEFNADFAAHIMRRLDKGERVKQFTTTNLRRLLMAENLTQIVTNSGFLNIAGAVRKATVTAQYLKKNKQISATYEVYYGLAQRWKQALQYKDRFVKELCDFIQKYNAENARLAEQNKPSRTNITTEDVNAVIGLIEEHSSDLIGYLLLAYGYAREPREETSGETPAQSTLESELV